MTVEIKKYKTGKWIRETVKGAAITREDLTTSDLINILITKGIISTGDLK